MCGPKSLLRKTPRSRPSPWMPLCTVCPSWSTFTSYHRQDAEPNDWHGYLSTPATNQDRSLIGGIILRKGPTLAILPLTHTIQLRGNTTHSRNCQNGGQGIALKRWGQRGHEKALQGRDSTCHHFIRESDPPRAPCNEIVARVRNQPNTACAIDVRILLPCSAK